MRVKKTDTRGAYYGINAIALKKDGVIKLDKIKLKVSKLSEPWFDADALVDEAVQKVLQSIDDLKKQLEESAEYMNEPMDGD